MANYSCPLCGYGSKLFLIRQDVPVQQNFLFDDQDSARAASRGNLEMAVCERCGFVHNSTFDPEKVPYGSAYDNAQTYSPRFVEYLKDLARYVIEQTRETGNNIVEVGCGNGYFLRLLIQSDSDNCGYGFDPSYRGASVEEGGRLRFESRYYDRTCAHIVADVVVCRHVIEHVKQPLDLLATIREALVNSHRARIFLETPCVEWILRNVVFWDFFYEHCSLFSEAALAAACGACGFRVEGARHTFGGQYLWLEAALDGGPAKPDFRGGNLVSEALRFAEAERRMQRQWSARIAELLRGGAKLAVWGAGAKGATFVNLIDPGCESIDCVIDINPNKQGKFVPGSGHPIVSYRELPDRGIDTAILMNANYETEIRSVLQDSAIKLTLLC